MNQIWLCHVSSWRQLYNAEESEHHSLFESILTPGRLQVWLCSRRFFRKRNTRHNKSDSRDQSCIWKTSCTHSAASLMDGFKGCATCSSAHPHRMTKYGVKVQEWSWWRNIVYKKSLCQVKYGDHKSSTQAQMRPRFEEAKRQTSSNV